MSALEKFKRRLVRDIARRQYVENQPEEEMWDQLKTEYGCDCFLLWQHMKVLTSKKLKRLLAADDRVERITQVARMTSTDWLTFDLVLVHQDVDVIGEGQIQSGKPESQVLMLLFNLVVMYCIEDCSGDRLVGKWAALTRAYNTGGRECSAMLLQRRWHQLKDLSRRRIYEFWKQYRGNSRNLPKAVRPTNLQIQISETLPYLITERFIQWKDLLESGKIIQAVQFENRRRKMESNVRNDDPDLVVIEPHVETIELGADSEDDEVESINEIVIDNTEGRITAMDIDDNQFEQNTYKNADNSLEIIDNDTSDSINKENDVKNPVKTEPTEVLDLNDTLSDDEAIEIDNFENTEEIFKPEHVENHCEYPENDIVLPKITNVMGNVDIESNDKYNSISHITNNEVLSDEDAPKVSDIASSINPGDSNKTFEENVKKNPAFNANDIMDISELPSTLEFVDDGIEFVDDDEDSLEGKVDTDDGNKIVNLDDVDPSYAIDRKLVMIPITYTKKLEDMNVLKNISYSTVKGDQLIELIESESKIITLSEEIKTEVTTDYEHTEEMEIENNSGMTRINGETDESRSQDNSQMNNVTNIETDVSKYAIKVKEEITKGEDDLEKCEIPRVKYTSWLLQKPKHRNYNPILLCKNPDFNTRLKRLGVGFFLSERNRQLFNACKPLTIDMHKAFETKLVNNVLYLEKTTTPYIKEEKVAEVCENTASVIPSAVPVQSLLDMTRVEQKYLLPQKTQIDESKSSPDPRHEDDRVIERGHVINEPLMSTMDLAKQRLIKKEKTTIAPTPVSNTKRPAEIIGAALSTLPPPTNNKKSKTKPKPPAPAPRWTTYGTVIEYEESLITKDTLNKVLCFLDTGIFQMSRKGGAAPSELTRKPTTKGPIPNPPSTNETSAQDKRLKSTSDNDELNWNNLISQNSKRRRNDPHSITPQSGYCCWARNKIDYLRTENKNINSIKAKQYRHLCPMGESGCICCCRQDLLETMVLNKLQLDHTYSRESDPPLPKVPTKIETRDIAIQARLIRNESGQMEIKSTIELYHPQNKILSRNDQGKIALDEVTKNSNDSTTIPLAAYTAHPSSGSKQSVDNDAKKFAHASSDTSDFLLTDNETAHVESPPIIKTNVISALPHRGNKAELFSVTAEAGRQPTPPSIAVNKNLAQKAEDEVISLIDEEESAPPNQTSSSAPKQLLPKGVNILLLPDKTLSVSIEPGVQIDPVNLSKLPEILSAVQSKLMQPGLLNKYQKFPIRRWKYPSGKQTASRNTVDNHPTVVNVDPQKKIVNENPKVNAVNPGLNDIYETAELNTLNTDVNVTEDNAELVVMDPGVQVSSKSELNSMTPEVNFPKKNAEVAVPQQNAELVAIDPILPVEKGQAEHNMNPEFHSSEEHAELIVLDPKVPVTEENDDLVVNSKIDTVDKNAELTVINVNARNCEVNVINNELITTAENAVNDMNSVVLVPQASVHVVNDQLNASEENTYLSDSNTDTNFTIAETTPMLYVDSLQPTIGNTAENVTEDDEDKLMYTDYIVKVKPPDTSRKTILSDLMTMSGISTEDANMPTEPPAANVINYNLQDDPYYLTNTYNVGGNIQIAPPPKKVKKVMVFIKKRSKAKPLLNESVIDLTEDNDNSAETSKQNDPQTDDSPKKGSDGNKTLNLKRAKLVRVPAAAVPHKIYQAAQSLLRKDNTFPVQDETTVSSREIETQMKLHLARHYRKLNKKPTILDILKNIKHSKEIQATKQSRNQSESSDDEPLAKKSRRMRTENTDDNISLNVVPVGQYNLPAEYKSNEPVMFVPATSDVQDADDQNFDTEDVDTQNADNQETDILDADTQNVDDQEADILDTNDRDTDILDADDQGSDTNTDADEGAILGI